MATVLAPVSSPYPLPPHLEAYLLTLMSGTLMANPMYFSLGSVDSFLSEFYPTLGDMRKTISLYYRTTRRNLGAVPSENHVTLEL